MKVLSNISLFCSKSLPISRWQKVLDCQSVSKTTCIFSITNVFIEYWLGVASLHHNCSSNIQRASTVASPLHQSKEVCSLNF